MSRADQTNIYLAISDVTDSSKALLFQNLQQLWLDLKIDITNLIEEN
jgi:hypothetical protein